MPTKPKSTRKQKYAPRNFVALICPSCKKPFQRLKWDVKRTVILRPTCGLRRCFDIERRHQKQLHYLTATTKCCPECKRIKPSREFATDKRFLSGHAVYCRRCQKKHSRKYKPNESKKRAKHKASIVLRLGNRCAKCGVENLPICCYEFHHRNEQDKEFTISVYLAHQTKELDAEINKCELLCACCHATQHSKYTNLPATQY